MNAQSAKNYLPIFQALSEGKPLQFQSGNEWIDVRWDEDESTNMKWLAKNIHRIRIKPETRRWWIVIEREIMSTDGINEYCRAYTRPITVNKCGELVEVIEVSRNEFPANSPTGEPKQRG